MSPGEIASFDEFWTRPPDHELMPVIVRWKTGGSNYDYICAGLASGQEVLDYQRGNKTPGFQLIVWEPRTVIKYNKESGSLSGSSVNPFRPPHPTPGVLR